MNYLLKILHQFHRTNSLLNLEVKYRLHTVSKVHFDLQWLICGKKLTIKHKNIEFVPMKINHIGEDLQDKSRYQENLHRHSKRCHVTCIALHTKTVHIKKSSKQRKISNRHYSISFEIPRRYGKVYQDFVHKYKKTFWHILLNKIHIVKIKTCSRY